MQPNGSVKGVKTTQYYMQPAPLETSIIRPKVVDQKVLALLNEYHRRNVGGKDAKQGDYPGFRQTFLTV